MEQSQPKPKDEYNGKNIVYSFGENSNLLDQTNYADGSFLFCGWRSMYPLTQYFADSNTVAIWRRKKLK